MISTLTSYKALTRDTDHSIKGIAAQRSVERETSYYLSTIRSIKSIDDFMGDRRIYSFTLRSFGLDGMIGSKALIRKVLEGGIDNRDSLANTLADSRFKELVESFNFVRYGATTTTFGRTQQGTVDRFLRQALEERAGDINEGVRLALYFERKAPAINNLYGLLADRALYKVVETALALPSTLPASGIEKQAAIIGKKLDINSLRDPKKVKELIERFASLWDLSQQGPQSTAASILQRVTPTVSIASETLATIQGIRPYRR